MDSSLQMGRIDPVDVYLEGCGDFCETVNKFSHQKLVQDVFNVLLTHVKTLDEICEEDIADSCNALPGSMDDDEAWEEWANTEDEDEVKAGAAKCKDDVESFLQKTLHELSHPVKPNLRTNRSAFVDVIEIATNSLGYHPDYQVRIGFCD